MSKMYDLWDDDETAWFIDLNTRCEAQRMANEVMNLLLDKLALDRLPSLSNLRG